MCSKQQQRQPPSLPSSRCGSPFPLHSLMDKITLSSTESNHSYPPCSARSRSGMTLADAMSRPCRQPAGTSAWMCRPVGEYKAKRKGISVRRERRLQHRALHSFGKCSESDGSQEHRKRHLSRCPVNRAQSSICQPLLLNGAPSETRNAECGLGAANVQSLR